MSNPTAPAPPRPRSGLRAAWGRLDHRQRRVVAAAVLVLATMVLPWYSKDTVTPRGPGSFLRSGGSVSGFAGMSFIEASLLVVLIGVLVLFWGRGSGRRFALPFPDGSLVCAAAGWMGLLIVYRLFAKPHGVSSAREQTLIGLNWGIFVSLLAVGVLFAAGFDLRRHRPRGDAPRDRGPAPPSRYPDVDPATMVVRPRSDEPATAVAPTPHDDQATTVVPSPERRPAAPADDQPTRQVPAAPADDQPTRQVPAAPADDQPTRQVPAAPAEDQPTRQVPAAPPQEQPTAVAPPVRRTPTPPRRPADAEPGSDWPSRMRRPRTPTPRQPPTDRPADERRRGGPDERD